MITPTLTLAAGAGDLSATIVDLIKILAVAAAVSLLMQRLRLQIIPAYLIGGALLGLTGLMEEAAGVTAITELAIVLLLFGIGLHLDVNSLKVGLAQTIAAALLAVFGAALALWPVAATVAQSWEAALAVAMALSLSSTAVVLRLLHDARELHRMHGRMSLAILVVQDIVVIPMLLVIPLLAKSAGTIASDPGTEATGESSAFLGTALSAAGVAAIAILGRYGIPAILRFAAKSKGGSSEVMFITTLAFAIGAAGLTQILGLSAALGAFLAGFTLSNTAFKYQLSGQIGSIRDLFMAVFFTAVGTSIQLVPDAAFWTSVLVGSAAVLTIKALVIAAACWAAGLASRLSTMVGGALAPAGEFGIVILGVAASTDNALISGETLSLGIAIIFISMLVNPATLAAGHRLAEIVGNRMPPPPWMPPNKRLDEQDHDDANAPSVIVAGFGVVGRAVVDRLQSLGVNAAIVEMNMTTVEKLRARGRPVLYGDIADHDVLESAGVRSARALVLTVPDESAVLRACRAAKHLNPSIFIVARTSFLSRGMRASAEGADATVVEELVTAQAMEALVEKRVIQPLSTDDPPISDTAPNDDQQPEDPTT